MKHTTISRRVMVIFVVGLLVTGAGWASTAYAQSGGGYDLTWSTIDGGGYMFSTGGNYSLGETSGQPDAGAPGGGSYTLAGGFWNGAIAQYHIYLPVVLKQ
jgi:hypothetical protein